MVEKGFRSQVPPPVRRLPLASKTLFLVFLVFLGVLLVATGALAADADALERAGSSLPDFLSSFTILLREGLEAILVLAALIAYLGRVGQADQVRTVYGGTAAAVAASLLTAWALGSLLRTSEATQEVLEGVTMLVAAAVLFLVSFWLLDKAQARAWNAYIQGKLSAALSRRSRLTLWWAAFLAVYREGAETVLFFQALVSSGAARGQVGLGFALGLLVLVGVFILVRWGSLKIPLRPFFAVTGVLLYYLTIVFAGKGIHELQEGGVIAATPLQGSPAVEWLGLYPTWEGVAIQAALLLLALAAFLVKARRDVQGSLAP